MTNEPVYNAKTKQWSISDEYGTCSAYTREAVLRSFAARCEAFAKLDASRPDWKAPKAPYMEAVTRRDVHKAEVAKHVPVNKQPEFYGTDIEPWDVERLQGQMKRIYDLMRDREWRTLDEIAEVTGDPTPSISAQLRGLRREKYGSHTVNRRRRGGITSGLWEYQLEK